MDREAWRAAVYGVTRVGHDLATKPPPPPSCFQKQDPNYRLAQRRDGHSSTSLTLAIGI